MKKFGILFAGALALLGLAACSNDLEVSPNESYYASEATITSSDSNVTISGNDAEVTFKVEGGTVTLTVDCGCEWTATSYKPEYFTATTTSTSVTITAVQNTIENELAGVVSLMTAGESIQFAKIQVYQNAYGAPEITVSSNEWNAPAVGALTTEIAVTASDEWDIENTAEWLTVEKTSAGISLTADENGKTTERETKVTLICTDGINSDSETITVIQDALAYITLSDESLTLFGNASSNTITVESNFDDWSYDKSADWITIVRNGDALTVSVGDNEGESRNGTVTVTAGDGAENVAEAQLTVTQGSIADMILTYTITSANTTTYLPLYGTVNCTVDWGDGSETVTVTSQWPSHTYAKAGEYDIIVNGTMTQLTSVDISTSADPLPLTAVKQWGKTGLVKTSYAFTECKYLKSLPEYTGDALDDVTDVSGMFNSCSALEEIPEGLFAGCSNAKDFSYAFYGCDAIKTVPQGLFDNCTSATTFMGAFYSCANLETIPDALFANCTEVTNFRQLFSYCPLKAIPANTFRNCAKVEDIYMAFCCCPIEEIPADLFADCTVVTKFDYTFYYCTSLTSIPSSLFSNNKNATSFYGTFEGDTALTGESPYDLIEVDGVETKVHLYERDNYTDIYATIAVTGKGRCFRDCTGLSDYYSIPSGWGGGK